MFNVAITLAFAVIMGFGQIVLSLAASEIFPKYGFSINSAIHSRWLWLGILIYGVAMILWIYILSRFDVRYAYPISATAIFFAAFFQSIIQKTFPSGSYWLGLFVVVIGLIILSLNNNS